MKMLSKCALMAVDSTLIIESLPESRIILDIREPSCYEKSHLKNSINLLTSGLLLRRLQRGSLTITSLLPERVVRTLQNDQCDSLVLYDENSSTENENRTLTVISSALKKSFPKKNICYLNKGFAQFCEDYPQHCEFDYPVEGPNPLQITLNQDLSSDPTDRNAFSPDTDLCPVSILPYIYLGNANHASQKELLDKLGVTAILNVSKTCPVVFKNSYEYKTIAVDDNARENISTHFDDAIKFIDDVKSRNGKVLVHCRAGISRSATICIAYLMRKYDYTLDQAYEYTKKRRAAISPNFNFLGQLLALESELNAKRKAEEMQRPSTARFPLPLTLDIKKAPLTCTQFNKNTEFFTYSPVPKTCLSFFNGPEVSSPCLALMTPS
jgi:dual specificity MAP kinase phosphatase